MKKIWLCAALMLSMVLLLSGCMGLPGEDVPDPVEKGPLMVDVMVQQAPGITVTGENPMRVKAGDSVSFAVSLDSNYKIKEVGQGATYENGILTLKEVKYPTTVEIETRPLMDLEVKLTNNAKHGEVTSNVNLSSVKEDTTVTLKAAPKTGMVFLGYSLGAPQEKGGVIVEAGTEYTVKLSESMDVYTNYYNMGAGGGQLVIYDGNGAAESNIYYVFSADSPYIGPNALANKGQFTKEGHVLVGYNTKADGSGDFYGPGWSVILPTNSSVPMTLYAQWLPVTETEAFTYTTNAKNQIVITRYKGTHETVVIPEMIDGKPVVEIASDAFINSKFKTLYLSKNLLTIKDGAFLNCKSFTTLYLCDTLISITDNAFTRCTELQKLYMLAVLDPRYSTSNNGTYKVKYQRLRTAEGKKIIFHAGSNVSYGIDIPTIQNKLSREYAGVNFGCNQGTPAVFYMEVAAAYMNKGDLLVLCPEYHKYQYGYNEMNTTTWQIFEGAYNAYADVDIRNYIKVFSSFASFNNSRYSSTPRTYEQYCKSGGAPAVTKYGEYNVNHEGQNSSLMNDIAKWEKNGGVGSLNIDLGFTTASYNKNLNKAIDMVLAKGGKVYISFASTLNLALNKESQVASRQQAFKAGVIKAFPKATVISDPSTYIMDKKYFFNSYYHLSGSSSVIRAEMLAKDILAQFAKEK